MWNSSSKSQQYVVVRNSKNGFWSCCSNLSIVWGIDKAASKVMHVVQVISEAERHWDGKTIQNSTTNDERNLGSGLWGKTQIIYCKEKQTKRYDVDCGKSTVKMEDRVGGNNTSDLNEIISKCVTQLFSFVPLAMTDRHCKLWCSFSALLTYPYKVFFSCWWCPSILKHSLFIKSQNCSLYTDPFHTKEHSSNKPS